MDQWHGDREQEKNIREIKIHIYAKRQTLICTAWPSFPLKCHLLLITFTHKKSSLMPVLSIRIVSGQFLSAYFLFWEILNLNLLFAVNVTVNLSNMEKERKTFFCSHSLPHPPHCFFFSDLIDLSPQSECLEQDTIRLVSVRWVLQRSSCSCSLQSVPVTSSYNEYRKSSIKPPLSNEPSSLIRPPPPPNSPYYSSLINEDCIYQWRL